MAESRSDVSLTPPSNVLGPIITGTLGELINIEDIEIVIDTTDPVIEPSPPNVPSDVVPRTLPPGGVDTNQQQPLAQPGTTCQDPESCAVLRADNAQLREALKTQDAELSMLREKCLQLENHSSTGWLF